MKPPSRLQPAGLLGLLFLAPIVGAFAQDTSKLIPNPRILFSSTVRKADGGTTTYQHIAPPTAEQLAALRQTDLRHVQGYRIARPMPFPELVSFVRARSSSAAAAG